MCSKELSSHGSDKACHRTSSLIDNSCGISDDSELSTTYSEVFLRLKIKHQGAYPIFLDLDIKIESDFFLIF